MWFLCLCLNGPDHVYAFFSAQLLTCSIINKQNWRPTKYKYSLLVCQCIYKHLEILQSTVGSGEIQSPKLLSLVGKYWKYLFLSECKPQTVYRGSICMCTSVFPPVFLSLFLSLSFSLSSSDHLSYIPQYFLSLLLTNITAFNFILKHVFICYIG